MKKRQYLLEDGTYDCEYAKVRAREKRLASKYGMSLDEYDAFIFAQSGKCAICGKFPGVRGLVVDHDHKGGNVRELLCTRCNMALGQVDDSIDILWKMIMYLRRWKAA